MSKLTGASTWEEDLYEHLTSHEANERAMLIDYRDAATASSYCCCEISCLPINWR